MKKLFGTDGIRGKAGEFPLDTATVRVIGRSLAQHLAENSERSPQIVIGRDTRESGPWIERALIAGAHEAGAQVKSAGVITTPGVAFLTRTLAVDAGVVISASHNPYYDNGIKVFKPSGRKLDDAVERQIEADIANSEASAKGNDDDASETMSSADAAKLQSFYAEYLTKEVAGDLSLANLNIVMDCANGAAYQIAPEVFRRLGANVIAINDRPDGHNINLNCGSLHIEALQKQVTAHRADLGVAFDGDADRALFVDEAGDFVDGDATLWILANDFKARGELNGNTVVATVMSNIGLELAFRAQGTNLTRTDVGDKYVLEEVLRSGAALGGEQSGHIIFPRVSLAGDGIITTIMLLRAMRQREQPLSELTRVFQRYPQLLVNVPVRERRPFEDLPSVQDTVREIGESLDGRGRLLLRYSGTEPLARIMIEGEDERQIANYAQKLADQIRQEIGVTQPGDES
ncbi:MAG TPA: phosphoglucosamine mutase [Pyrinomonadaceae bacterium]|nr:phosphoglucosamine mutase [Pyrinomonadaceae bacterium]